LTKSQSVERLRRILKGSWENFGFMTQNYETGMSIFLVALLVVLTVQWWRIEDNRIFLGPIVGFGWVVVLVQIIRMIF
jgi:hypothetical protein